MTNLAPLLLLLGALCSSAAGLEVAFDAANKLYEEGKYGEAVTAYEAMLTNGIRSAPLYYNLGTACYRAGRMGAAVLAFRRAEELTPRDANLRANLQFVRQKVNGEDKTVVPAWRAWLSLLTLNEGTMLAAAAFWIWFLLLAAREARPALKRILGGYTLAAGLLTLLLSGLVGLAAWVRLGETPAVVTVKEAVIRVGPLEEARTAFLLPDGSEVTVLDVKDNWLQVRDISKRVGWVRRNQVTLVAPGGVPG
jgi:tetratricopeptide (TPR) repeat protein